MNEKPLTHATLALRVVFFVFVLPTALILLLKWLLH
jgi:hypothetical protein